MDNNRKQILKQVPNYLNNVTKSVMFSGMDIIKEVAPEMSESVLDLSQLTKNVMYDGRKLQMNVKNYMKSFKDSQVMKDVNQAKSNALEDLKSGNFYNKQRESDNLDASIASEDADMLKDLGLDFDSSDMDNMDDEAIIAKLAGKSSVSEKSGDTSNNVTINNITSTGGIDAQKSALSGIAAVSRVGAVATVQAATVQMDHDRALHSISTITTYKMHNEIMDRLTEATGYLKGLLDYSNSNVSKHFEATMMYYDKSMTSFDTITAGQKELVQLTRTAYNIQDPQQTESGDKVTTDDVLRGGFHTSKYGKLVSQRLKDKKDSNMFLNMFGFMNDLADTTGQTALQVLFNSPLKVLSKGMAHKVMGKDFKESMKDLNSTFTNFFQSASIKTGNYVKDKDNPLFNSLFDIFGLSPDGKKSVGLESKNIGKPVPFDDPVRNSIIDVIPTYLRKILSSLTGQPEKIYDYTTGKYRTKSTIDKEHTDRINDTYKQNDTLRGNISNKMGVANLSAKDRNLMLNDFDTLSKFIIDEQVFFNPNKDSYEQLQRKGLNLNGGNNSFESLKNLILSEGKKGVMGLNRGIFDQRKDYNSYISSLDDTASISGKSSLFNDFDTDIKPVKGLASKTISGELDKYGMSLFDYIRDIKGILLEGILVYSTGTVTGRKKNNTNDNQYTRRLDDYRNELRRYEATDTTISNSAAQTYGANYVSPQNRDTNNKVNAGNSVNEMTLDRFQNLSPRTLESLNSERTTDVTAPRQNRLSSMLRGFNPASLATSGVKFLDNALFDLLYGKSLTLDGSFIDATKDKATEFFTEMNSKFMEKFLNPLEEKLFGENGLMTKFETWFDPKWDKFKNTASSKLLGNIGESGIREGGLLSKSMNRGSDYLNHGLNMIIGKEFTSKITGEKVNMKDNTVISNIKKSFEKTREDFAVSLFGQKEYADNGELVGRDGNGWLSKLKMDVTSTFMNFKDKYFGEKENSINMEEVLPKALSGVGIGLGTSLFSTLFLPMGIGMVPAMLLGGAAGFVSSNDKLKEKLFGSDDQDGLIPKNWQKNFQKYFPNMATGTAVGGVLGTLTGNPILGPILGASIGFATKSEKLKDFLFGTEGNPEPLISKQLQDGFKKALPGGLMAGAGIMAYSNLGLIGSSLLPGGPIGAGILGLGTTMLAQSDTFKNWLWGKEDPESGIKEGGVLGKMQLWFQFEVMEQFKLDMKGWVGNANFWFKEKIGNPLVDAVKPVTEELKRVGKNIFSTFTSSIGRTFENSIGMPIKNFLDDQVFSRFKKIFGGLFNTIKSVVEMPFQMISKNTEKLTKKHERMGMEYVSDWKAKRNERNTKLSEDRNAFEDDYNKQKEKLSLLQRVLRKGNYESSSDEAKAVLTDFYSNYTNKKYKENQEFLSSKFDVLDSSVKDGNDTSKSILDRVSNLVEVVKDSIKNVKDKAVDKFDSVKTKVSDSIPTMVNVNGGLAMEMAGSSFGGFKRISSNEFKNRISDKKPKAVKTPRERQTKSKKTSTASASESDTEGESETINDITSTKTVKAGKVKTLKNKSGVTGVIRGGDISSILFHTKSIDKEVHGQLDGVGNNIDSIRRILSKFTGIDEKGAALRGNKERRGFLGKLQDMVTRPFDYIGTKLRGTVDNIAENIKSGFNNVMSFGKNTLKTVGKIATSMVNTLNSVINVGVKALGTAVDIAGQVLTTTAEVFGTVAKGVISGLGYAIGGISEGLGKASKHLVHGIGALSGGLLKLAGGIGHVTGSVLKAGAALADGMITVTKDIVSGIYEGTKKIFGFAGNLISAPFRAFNKLRGGKDGSVKDVRVTNFIDLLTLSEEKPMHVYIKGVSDTAQFNCNCKCIPEIKEEKIITPTPLDLGKTSTNGPVDSIGKFGMNLQLLAEKQEKTAVDVENQKQSKLNSMMSKLKPQAIKKNVGSIFNSAEADVTSHVTRQDVNYQNEYKALEKGVTEKAVLAQSMAQSAEAAKGTFGILSKMTGKKSLLSKVGSMLFMALPAIMAAFSKFKAAGGIFGLLGKMVGPLISKVMGSGLVQKLLGTKAGGAIAGGISKILPNAFKSGATGGFNFNFGEAGRSIATAATGGQGSIAALGRAATTAATGGSMLSGAGSVIAGGAAAGGMAGRLLNRGTAQVAGNALAGGANAVGGTAAATGGILGRTISSRNPISNIARSILPGTTTGTAGAAANAVNDITGTATTTGTKKRRAGNARPGSTTAQQPVNMRLENAESIARATGGATAAATKKISIFGRSGGSNIGMRIARSANMGLVGTLMTTYGASKATDLLENLLQNVLSSDFMKNAFGKYSRFIPKVTKFLTENLARVGIKKLPTLLTKLTTKAATLVGGGVASLGVIPAVMVGFDAVTGIVSAKKIFKVGKDAKLTLGMRMAASIAKLIDNNITFGFIDVSTIASFIYGLIGSEEKEEELKMNQQKHQSDQLGVTMGSLDKNAYGNLGTDSYNGYESNTATPVPVNDTSTSSTGVPNYTAPIATAGMASSVVGAAATDGKSVEEKPVGTGYTSEQMDVNTTTPAPIKSKGFIGNTLDNVKNGMHTGIENAKVWISDMGESVGKAWDNTVKAGEQVWKNTKEFGKNTWETTKEIGQKAWDGGVLALEKVGKATGTYVGATETSKGIKQILSGDFKGGLETTIAGVTEIFEGPKEALKKHAEHFIDQAGGFVGDIATKMGLGDGVDKMKKGDFWGGIKDMHSTINDKVIGAVQTVNDTVIDFGSEVAGTISKPFVDTYKWVKDGGLKDKYEEIEGKVTDAVTEAGRIIGKTVNDISSAVGDKIDDVYSWIKDGGIQKTYDSVKESVQGFFKSAGDIMSDMLGNIASGIGGAIDSGISWVRNGLSSAASTLSNTWNNITKKKETMASQRNSYVDQSLGKGPSGVVGTDANTKDLSNGANTRNLTQNQQQSINSNVQYHNGMVYFSQGDPKWGGNPYAAKGENSDIKAAGCGPTSMAMVLSSLTGQYVDPATTAAWSLKKGYKVKGSGTSWGYFKPQGAEYGVNVDQYSPDANKAKEALRSRLPVIFSGRGAAPFTSGGHFIVGAGLTSDGNNVIVNDPVNMERSKAYPVSQILGSARQMWVMSKGGQGLTGDNPAVMGGPAGGAVEGGVAPQEDNSLLGIMTQLGTATSVFADAVIRGETFTADMLQPQGATTSGAAINGTDGYSNAGDDLIGILLQNKYNLSTKFEVGEKALREGAGASYVSSGAGDAGGKSYGIPQFTTKAGGSVNSFVNWLQQHNPNYHNRLKKHSAGSSGFDAEWKAIASEDPSGFAGLQTKRADEVYYIPASSKMKGFGVDPESRSLTLRSEIYSTGVQFGAGGFNTVAGKAFAGKNIAGMDDKQLTAALNDEKHKSVGTYKFNGCSGNVQNGVRKRFVEEKGLTGQMYDREKGLGGKPTVPANNNQIGGGNGGKEVSSLFKAYKPTKQTIPINNDRIGGGNGLGKQTSLNTSKIKPVKPVIPNSTKTPITLNSGTLNGFIKKSYSGISNDIDDLLLADKMRNTEASNSMSGDFNKLLQLVKQIADNTSATAQNTSDIAEKDFSQTNVVDNSVNTNEVTDGTPNGNTNINMDTSNPFVSVNKNDVSTSKIQRGYALAKNIAKKK